MGRWLCSWVATEPLGRAMQGDRAAVGHPSSLQQYFDVSCQECLPLLGGLTGPPQAMNDLGLAAWAHRKIVEAYCPLMVNPLFLHKANFPKSMFKTGRSILMSDLRPCRTCFDLKPLHRKVPGSDHIHFPVEFITSACCLHASSQSWVGSEFDSPHPAPLPC